MGNSARHVKFKRTTRPGSVIPSAVPLPLLVVVLGPLGGVPEDSIEEEEEAMIVLFSSDRQCTSRLTAAINDLRVRV